MALTAADVQRDLDAVNAAISELIRGERRQRLQLGTNEYRRVYEFQEITIEALVAERTRLELMLQSLTNEPKVVRFRDNTNFPLRVTDRGI